MKQSRFLEQYGPWALVTGASDGIGRAFADQLAAMGFQLILVARGEERLKEVARECESRHGSMVRTVAVDLHSAEDRRILDGAIQDLDVGLLVAAAGFGTSGPFLDSDLETERNMLEVNCFALLQQSLTLGQRFAKRGRGGMILMASLVGWQGVPRAAHYAATKAYVQSLAEALHVELKPKGIDVIACAPGPVRSGFGARANMRMGRADLPVTVARASLRALGRRGTVVPGFLGNLLTYSLAPLPRPMRVRILAKVMGGMTQHQGGTRSA